MIYEEAWGPDVLMISNVTEDEAKAFSHWLFNYHHHVDFVNKWKLSIHHFEFINPVTNARAIIIMTLDEPGFKEMVLKFWAPCGHALVIEEDEIT